MCCPPPDFSTFEAGTCTAAGEMAGCARWVGPPTLALESQDNAAAGAYRVARLQCTPFYHSWASEGLIDVLGAEIVPSSLYDVVVYSAACKGNEDTCTAVSVAVTMATRRAGDLVAQFNPPSSTSQPDALDVASAVNQFKGLPGSPGKGIVQVQPSVVDPNSNLSALDIGNIVDSVKGFAYPFSGPCACPSAVPCDLTPCANASACTGAHGAGATCVRTCSSGPNAGLPCGNNSHCGQCVNGGRVGYPCDDDGDCPSGTCAIGTCGSGFCRDRCGRCSQ
jgi:hypothetical protein